MMRALCMFLLLVILASCAAASGYDASRYADESKSAKPPADVDTEPLPPQPKRSVADPRRPLGVKDAGP